MLSPFELAVIDASQAFESLVHRIEQEHPWVLGVFFVLLGVLITCADAILEAI